MKKSRSDNTMKYSLSLTELRGKVQSNIRDILTKDESRWKAELEKKLREEADKFITNYMLSIGVKLIEVQQAENMFTPEVIFSVNLPEPENNS